MLLSVLTNKLKIDSGQDDLGWNTMRRSFERAAEQVNQDLSTSFAIAGTNEPDTTILPDPDSLYQELLLILAFRFLVRTEQIQASNAITWKSGDKSVDRSRKALSKKEIVNDLWQEYLRLAGLDKDTLVGGEAAEPTAGDTDYTPDRRTWIDG